MNAMIARVERHNRLNGFGFVIGEFGLIGVVALVFGVLYLAKGSELQAVACAGITANSIGRRSGLFRGGTGICDTIGAHRASTRRSAVHSSVAWVVCTKKAGGHSRAPAALLLSSSSLLPPEERHGGGLLHPRGRQALVEIVHGCQLDAPC